MKEKPSANPIPAFYAACVLPDLIAPARECGYALGVHGSVSRDLDLIAVPWTESAVSAEELIAALYATLEGWFITTDSPEARPHGRRAWCIALMGEFRLDVSVMPRSNHA